MRQQVLYCIMNRSETIRVLVFIVIMALQANAIWLYEIAVVMGWHSLSWLYRPLYSPLIISLFPAVAYLVGMSVLSLPVQNKARRAGFAALLYLVNILFYFVGKQYCYMSFGRFGWWWLSLPFGVLIGLVIFLLLGASYYLVTKQFFAIGDRKVILIISAVCFMVVPASLVTFILIPGLGGPGSFVDGVKMGYPVFWITLLLGICGTLTRRYAKPAML